MIVCLTAQAVKGDSAAFIERVKLDESSLHDMARSMLRQDVNVADALQENDFNKPGYFKTWIFRILINECNTMLAGRSRSVSYTEVPKDSPFIEELAMKIDLTAGAGQKQIGAERDWQ